VVLLLYSIRSLLIYGSILFLSHIQWVRGALSLGIKRPGREADRSPPSSAEVKECVELYLHFPNRPSLRGAQFKRKITEKMLPLPFTTKKKST
jgi:hypothetical protein